MTPRKQHTKYFATLVILIILAIFSHIDYLEASEIDTLKAQIADRNNKIDQIEAEIAKYQAELAKTSGESLTLQNAIKTLNISRNKYLQDIKLTENKIQTASLKINQMSYEILDKESKITQNNKAVGESIRRLNELSNESLLATVLKYDTLSDYFGQVTNLEKLQSNLKESIDLLHGLKSDLQVAKTESEKNRQHLVSFKDDLADQKKVIENNKAEKDRLLAVTKNKEAEYQRLINEKIANKKQFESELFEFENQLKIKIDPNLIPTAGKGVLSWPLDAIFVTQQFGKTVDAKKLYVSGSHSGTDFRAAVGTKVKSVLAGVVEAVGNTDATCPNASYGKWVLIKHANGLSSLYAHLDVISVTKGQNIATGEKIALSGNTGYSTGPHLHLTVYASQGVKVSSLPSNACKGAIYTIPVADPKAYLDPMSFF